MFDFNKHFEIGDGDFIYGSSHGDGGNINLEPLDVDDCIDQDFKMEQYPFYGTADFF